MKNTIKFILGNRAGIKEDPAKAGIIEVRPGTKGVDLGEKKYAMAYIRVLDENHYLKGMCVYSDNLPDNYDVIKYCSDPNDCLKSVKTVTPDMKLNKGVMTKILDDADWKAWKESLKPVLPAYEFLRKPDKKIQ